MSSLLKNYDFVSWVLSGTQMFSSFVSILSYSYGESIPVSAEALDSSFSVPIGKAKVTFQ